MFRPAFSTKIFLDNVKMRHGADYRRKFQLCGKIDKENLIEFLHKHKDLYNKTENTATMCRNKYVENAANMSNKAGK